MTSSSKPRFESRARSCLIALAACTLTGCGGSAKQAEPATPAARPGYGQPAAPMEAAPDAETQSESAAPAPPAGAAPRSTQKADEERGGGASDFDALGAELGRALGLAAPDCTTAWAIRDRICDLADRLCDMAGRSAEPEVAERCSDGRTRCERATTRVRSTCAQ